MLLLQEWRLRGPVDVMVSHPSLITVQPEPTLFESDTAREGRDGTRYRIRLGEETDGLESEAVTSLNNSRVRGFNETLKSSGSTLLILSRSMS